MVNCENRSAAWCAGPGYPGTTTSSARGLAARAVLWLLRLYQRRISSLLPQTCRFYPTCSEYARQSIVKHGLSRGAWLVLRRLSRCHPLHPGGFDPVR
ncbi:MAG TPA: membrane protein insertion efficiency factor YidD [Armatimonadota bacterium]|nr:membrane protein insertion efficiency factor YidD [Armatimonadota bacterium]